MNYSVDNTNNAGLASSDDVDLKNASECHEEREYYFWPDFFCPFTSAISTSLLAAAIIYIFSSLVFHYRHECILPAFCLFFALFFLAGTLIFLNESNVLNFIGLRIKKIFSNPHVCLAL